MASILVVDDDLVLNQLLADILMYEGFEVVSAQRGSDALEILDSTAPDAVVLDMEMPDMDGRALCRRLRSQAEPEHRPISVVALASGDVAGLRDELGIEWVLRKPVHIPRLVALLGQLTSGAASLGPFPGQPPLPASAGS